MAVEGDRDGFGARIEYAAARLACAAGRRLPEGLLHAFSSALAAVVQRIDRRHTEAARRFLDQALGSDLSSARREELVRGAWRYLLELAVEDERLFGYSERVSFEFELVPAARAALSSGQGALLVTPHLGRWEASLLALARLGVRPLYAVARPPRNRPLSRHLQRLRERSGARLLPRHGALQHLQRVLRAGGFAALVPDQRARLGPVWVPFFGRLAACEQAPALLMRRCRVPILVGACLRTADRDRLRFRLTRVIDPASQRGKSIEDTVATVNHAMEELILESPEQYWWLHDRWPQGR